MTDIDDYEVILSNNFFVSVCIRLFPRGVGDAPELSLALYRDTVLLPELLVHLKGGIY